MNQFCWSPTVASTRSRGTACDLPSEGTRGATTLWSTVAIIEQTIQRNFEGTGTFRQSFEAGYGVTVLHSRDVASKQSCSLFDVALTEFLGFAQFAECFAD